MWTQRRCFYLNSLQNTHIVKKKAKPICAALEINAINRARARDPWEQIHNERLKRDYAISLRAHAHLIEKE